MIPSSNATKTAPLLVEITLTNVTAWNSDQMFNLKTSNMQIIKYAKAFFLSSTLAESNL